MKELLIRSFYNTGIYPLVDIYSNVFSYFVVENIPFISHFCETKIDSKQFNKYDRRKKYQRQKVAFLSSIIIADNPVGEFPHTTRPFCFDEIGGTIQISLKNEGSSIAGTKLKDKIRAIILGKTNIKTITTDADVELIKDAKRSKKINYMIHPRYYGFTIAEFSKTFKCVNTRLSAYRVRVIFEALSQQSRNIHIALYYLLRANSLINKYFTEEAGVNLQMVVEAIIEDYIQYKNVSRKKAFKILYERINIEGIEDLMEHGLSRNEFLAHMDKNMFTEDERINDPDAYCYGTYQYFVDFIMKYLQLKRKGLLK